jgi:hypothetical protein
MKAAILLLRGPSEDKQQQACLNFIEQQHWDLKHIIPYWSPETAVALVVAGAVGMIVVACFQKGLTALAAEIGTKGQVVYVHPEPTVVKPPRRLPSITDLIRRKKRAGETTRDIAEYFEIDSGEVRRIARGDMD